MTGVGWIVLSGGMGRRFGTATPKQLLPLNGRPLIAVTLTRLLGPASHDRAVVVAAENTLEEHRRILDDYGFSRVRVVRGGRERQDSVCQGLASFADRPPGTVVIHDGARPFVSYNDVVDAVKRLGDRDGIIFAQAASDSIKYSADGETVQDHLDRQTVWRAQTPQIFRYAPIQQALAAARREGRVCSDDASLLALTGGRCGIYPFNAYNIKITEPLDMKLAEVIDRNLGFAEAAR